MASLVIDSDSVAATGTRLVSASEAASTPSAAVITPAAADPVSLGVAVTLQARALGIDAYSTAGAMIVTARGQHLGASAMAYAEQEAANAASLHAGVTASTPVAPAAVPPPVMLPPLPPATAPAVGVPPGRGREISELVHSGPGTSALHTAAQELQSHAGELRTLGDSVITSAADIASFWSSESGMTAAHRVTQLGTWFHQHADHVEAAASAVRSHIDSFDRAKANIPTPGEFAAVESRLRQAAAANANPATLGRYAPVVTALQTQLATLNARATAEYAVYSSHAEARSITGDPLAPPPQPGGAAGLDHNVAGSPATSPDDQIVGPAAGGPRIVMVDDHDGPPTPAPSLPPTGEPIKLPQTPIPPQVINAHIDPDQPTGGTGDKPSSCDAGDVLVHLGEVLGGGVTAGAAVPAEIPSLGASTGLFIAGAAGVAAGVNGLRDCAK